jgi:hypothetical protein
MLLRAVQSSETALAMNAAGVLASVCAFDPGLARRVVAAPGVLRALVAMLQLGPSDYRACRASCVLASMAVGIGGRRNELAARLAAEERLVLALARFAQHSSGADIEAAALVLGAMACVRRWR